MTPALLTIIRQHKVELHALAEDWGARVALAEHCSGLSRLQAEQVAWKCLLEEAPHAACAACGHPDAAGAIPESLNYEFEPTQLILYRSPLLVNAKLTPEQEAARHMLESRSFDDVTRRKARQLAGKWDIPYLTRQYFEWIEHEGIAPKDPRAHFLDFIKTHRQRHGETV
jgi:hypothetical protein